MSTPTTPPRPNAGFGSFTLLIMASDPFVGMLLSSALDQRGLTRALLTAGVRECMDLCDREHPQVAVLDLDGDPSSATFDLAEDLRRVSPSIGLVLLSSHSDPRWAGAQRGLPMGAIYLLKSGLNNPERLRAAVHDAREHPLAVSRKGAVSTTGDTPRLTGKQVAIMRRVASGYTNTEIARLENQSEGSVEKCIQRLAKALDLPVSPGRNVRVLIATAFFRHDRSVHETSWGASRPPE